MANLAKLKERARSLEMREQWKEALEAYAQVVEESSGDDLETGVWNRIGDLHVRVGQTERALEAYDRAVDAYADAGLYNNAIALCRKILRTAPTRTSVYLRLGQISAAQGFLADARQNFLEYAQRMQRAGQLDASFSALREFADLSPEDTELRLLLAEQLRGHGREGEAVEQLRVLYGQFRQLGRVEDADDAERRIREIEPEADLSVAFDLPTRAVAIEEDYSSFGHISFDDDPLGADPLVADPEPAGASTPEMFGTVELDGEGLDAPEIAPLEGLESTFLGDDEPALEPSADDATTSDLPLLDFGGDALSSEPAADNDDASPLPLLDDGPTGDLDLDDDDDDTGGELEGALEIPDALPGFDDLSPADLADPLPPPTPLERARERVDAAPADLGAVRLLVSLLEEEGQREEEVEFLERHHRRLAEVGHLDDAVLLVRMLIERRPTDIQLYQKQVEYAFRAGTREPLIQAYLDLGAQLGPPAGNPKARAVYQRILELDPGHAVAREAVAPPPSAPAPSVAKPSPPAEEYIDLGALIMEDDEEATTRFVVPDEEPSGDEDRDFADMLSVFRQKVSENIGSEDSSSHYDLGLAFMEMGLIDEAISEFQVALRGGWNPLATLEVLGHCFVEKGQFAVATKVLERALQIPGRSESDVLGVVYQLGRCQEALGHLPSAQEHYERIVAVDIGFRDAAERLDRLRRSGVRQGF